MAQTVLIAEDEATIRTVVAISLQKAYNVLPACDADEALSVARSHEQIALLLTDVQIYGGSMNGIELAEHILEEKPGTKVLVMSGLPDSLVFRLSWKWKERSAVKIAERTREETTKALHRRREGRHLEAAFAGEGADLQAL